MMRARKKKYAIKRNYEPVGVYLKEMRERAGLTQREVSLAMGYSSSQFVSNFECGIAVPPLKKLKVMVNLYKMDVQSLLDLILKTERAVMVKTLEGRERG